MVALISSGGTSISNAWSCLQVQAELRGRDVLRCERGLERRVRGLPRQGQDRSVRAGERQWDLSALATAFFSELQKGTPLTPLHLF